MIRTIKRVLKISIILFSVLVFTSCHGSVGKKIFEIPEEFDMDREYEITFWAKNDTNKTQTAIYEKAIKDFEELYPNITINLRLYNDYGKIYNDVITNISTDTTPNVCITYPDHVATYLTGDNNVVSLDELMEDEEYGLGGSKLRYDSVTKEEIVPQFLNECSLYGKYYAIPFMRSTEACYVNKTYVEKLGYELPDILTWDFVWEVSEAAMTKDVNGNYLVNGHKVLIPFIYKSTDNMMIQMLWQRGGAYADDTGDIHIFNDTTKDILYTVSKHAKTGAFSTFKISSYPANFLNAGQCIFAIDSTAGATWMGTHAPLSDISEDKLVEFETEVMMIPQYNPDEPKMISQGPSVCVFNKDDSQEVLASWIFAQYLLTNQVQISYSETEGYVPVTIKAQNDELYLEYLSKKGIDNNTYYDVKINASLLLINNTTHTFVTPVFNGSTSLRDASGQMIENVTKSVRRKETIDDVYLENLFNDMHSLYRLEQNSNKSSTDRDLGSLPLASVVLIVLIVVVWVFMGFYVIIQFLNRKNK